MAIVTGTAGNDFIHVPGDTPGSLPGYFDVPSATSGDDTITPGGGDDIIKAGGGDDTTLFAGNFTAADQVDGGLGNDTVQLDGDYSAGVTFGATTMVGVETIGLAAGHSYNLTTANATVAAGARLKIDGSLLLASDTLIANASAETDGQVTLVGGAGNDTLTGGAGSDFIYLYQGGNDTAYGGAGDDVFVFFGTFTAADRIDGGPGNDIVYLHGNYSTGVTFTPTTMVNVETINLDDSFDLNDSFKLTTNDATVAAGQTLTVTGAFLSTTGHITFDGSAETDGNFVLVGGLASDNFTAGAGNDTFTGNGGNDTIKGGGGTDTAIYSGNRADYSIVFDTPSQTFTITDLRSGSPDGVDTATSIEQFSFADSLFVYDAAGHVTSQTTFDTAGIKPWTTLVLTFDASANLTSQTVNLDNGTRWTNTFDAAGAQGWTWKTDHYDAAGHALSQTGLNDDGTHWLTLFDVANQYAWANVTLNFDANWSQTGLSGTNDDGTHTIVRGPVMAALDTALWFTTPYDPAFDPAPAVFSGASANYVVTFDAAAEAYDVSDQRPDAPDGTRAVENASLLQFSDGALPAELLTTRYIGSAGEDVLTGNDRSGFFDLVQGGNDTATGGSGNDAFDLGASFTAADRIDGGAGNNNQVQLDGSYTGTIALDGTAIKNVEVLAFGPGHDYTVATSDTLVGSGQTFSFWSASMGPENHVSIDGHLETDGNFQFFLGQGDNSAVGGAGNDVFYGWSGADTLTGNGGSDVFSYLLASDSNGSAYDTLTDFVAGTDKINLADTPVTAIDSAVFGTLSAASFDGDLNAVLGNGQPHELDQGHAVLFTATSGDLGGQTFLVVGTKGGAAGYDPGADYVFDVPGGTAAGLVASDFI